MNNNIRGDLGEAIDAFYARNGDDQNVKVAAREIIKTLLLRNRVWECRFILKSDVTFVHHGGNATSRISCRETRMLVDRCYHT